VQLASLQGRLFFDYNGNGIQDAGEPAVLGAKVQLTDNAQKVVTVTLTDSAGDYKLEDVPAGRYGLSLLADKKFRYMCRSVKEFRAIDTGYVLNLNTGYLDDMPLVKNQKMDFGLMEGYLTLPFPRGTQEFRQRSYVDVGHGNVGDWQGKTQTYPLHQGTDFFVPEGTKILAAAPGMVTSNRYEEDNGNVMGIDHLNGDMTWYAHLNSGVGRLDEMVSRGHVIGLSGHTGRLSGNWPHVHFGVYKRSMIDPYRDLLDPNSVSLWTVDNEPQYPS
jgi:murein DD-endopeptidase MepM/ murein hydrolase activator NlpD